MNCIYCIVVCSYKLKNCFTLTLYKTKVLVTAKPHPAAKARRIIALEVVGGAEAKPNGFSNFNPQISILRSTSSIGV